MLTDLLRRLRYRFAIARGRAPRIAVERYLPVERHGSAYGGWSIVRDSLRPGDVVYSFGLGDDISFDLSVVARYGVQLHAFDPTPRSRDWIASQVLPATLQFHPLGIAAQDGSLTFYPPTERTHMSFSAVGLTGGSDGVSAPVKRLQSIMKENGHEHLALLKMDIEGSEYEVIPTLAADGIFPDQLLIEFHHRLMGDGVDKSNSALRSLSEAGYRVVAVSPTGDEVSLVREGFGDRVGL